MDSAEEILEALNQGYSEEEIRKVLREKGLSQEEIRELFAEARQVQEQRSRSEPEKGEKSESQQPSDTQVEDSDSQDSSESVSASEESGGTRRPGLGTVQSASWLAALLASSAAYAGFETGFLSIPALNSTLFLSLGGLIAAVALFNLVTGLYQAVSSDVRKGLLPLTGSIGLILLVATLFIPLSSGVQALLDGSISRPDIAVLAASNGTLLWTGALSGLFYRRRAGNKAMALLLIPLVAVAGSYMVFSSSVASAAEDLDEASFERGVLGVEASEERVVGAARSPPPLNRFRAASEASVLLVGTDGGVLSPVLMLEEVSVYRGEPHSRCSTDNILPRYSTGSNTGMMVKTVSRASQVATDNREFLRSRYRALCEQQQCSRSPEEAVREVQELTEASKKLLKAVAPDSDTETGEVDLNPACSGSEKYKVKLKSIKCDSTPELKLESLRQPITSQATFKYGKGVNPLEENSVQAWKGEKTLEFSSITGYSGEPMDNGTVYRFDLKFPDARVEFHGLCKPGEGLCGDCEPESRRP